MRARPSLALTVFIAVGGTACVRPVPVYAPSEICRPAASGNAGSTPPLLIDDAEDGDDQDVVQDGRGGFFYTFVDPRSELVGGTTEQGMRPTPLVGGANRSRCAWNLRGTMDGNGLAFAGFGMNLVQPKHAYDASRFGGISFFARRSPGSSGRIRVHLYDGNTDPSGHVCTDCFNDFGADIVLTEQWTKYTFPFDSLRQLPGWGIPRPPQVDASRLFGIGFLPSDQGAAFDMWFDDISFIAGAE